MTKWKTCEFEELIFSHEGWIVKIWPDGSIDVDSPHEGKNGVFNLVCLLEEGLDVSGYETGPWQSSPLSFAIPWPVIYAICEAREIGNAKRRESGTL